MNEIFETVLAICLDRQADGDSPEACAADFPEFPDLLPLLELASALSSLPQPEVRPTWLSRSGNRVADRLRLARPPQPID